MTVVTTRPDATTSNTGVAVTGAATAHAALSDDSDSSYVTTDAPGDELVLGCAEPSLPAGSVVKGVELRLRTSSTGTSSMRSKVWDTFGLSSSVHMVTWSTPTTTLVCPWPWDVGSALAISASVAFYSGAASKTYEAFVDTTYVAKPTVNVTAPTGTVTDTNIPTVTFTPTLDSDGGAQTKRQIKIFTSAQYGAGGFDPSSSTATHDSGVQDSASASYALSTPLANATYRAYVRVGQTVNGTTHWSDWDYEGFVVNVTPPNAPSITATGEDDDGRIKIDLDDAASGPSTDLFEIEKSADGVTWESMRVLLDNGRVTPGSRTNLVTNPSFETNTTGWSTSAPAYHLNSGAVLTRVTPVIAQSGAYVGQIVTPGSAAAEGVAYAFSGYTFLAGTAYTLSMRVMANSATNVDLILGKASADYTQTDPTLAAGVWTDLSVTWTPAADGTAVYAVLRTDLGGAAVARTIQFDKVMVEAASSAGTYIEGVEGTTVYDYEAVNGVTTYYRARALHSYSGVHAASSWATDDGGWESPGWWLKHPTRPALNVQITVYSAPGYSRAARQGVFNVAGRNLPVVVDGVRGGKTGSLVLDVETAEERAAIEALLDEGVSLLLQGREDDNWEDIWVRFANQESSRQIDKAYVEATFESLPWTEVERPSGVIVEWPA